MVERITIKYESDTGKKPEKYIFTGKNALKNARNLINKKYIGGIR